MEVRYDGVAKRFGATQALEPLDLTVPDGTFLAMLGPSGCGKTTLLRLIAGLDRPDAGDIWIDGRHVAGSARATSRSGPRWPGGAPLRSSSAFWSASAR